MTTIPTVPSRRHFVVHPCGPWLREVPWRPLPLVEAGYQLFVVGRESMIEGSASPHFWSPNV